MFGFLKKILGLPTEEEILAAKKQRVISPLINNKTGDVVDIPKLDADTVSVSNQITDSVTVKKVKKARKSKEEKPVEVTPVKVKSTRGRKPAAKKV